MQFMRGTGRCVEWLQDRGVLLGLVLVFQHVFLLPYCNALFRCGWEVWGSAACGTWPLLLSSALGRVLHLWSARSLVATSPRRLLRLRIFFFPMVLLLQPLWRPRLS